MTDLDLPALERSAESVRANAHTPYSNFRVRTAVRAASDSVYVGN